MRSPSRTWNEGTVVARPLTAKWPWLTSWRAWARLRGEAHPEHDVVEAGLEQAQQVLAGHARA